MRTSLFSVSSADLVSRRLQLTQSDTREERRFAESNEESTDGKTGARGHCWHANCGNTPGHHHGGQKPSGICLRKPQVTGKLANQISNVEGGYAGVPYGVVHVQVLLQTSKTRIGDIDSIEVAILCE